MEPTPNCSCPKCMLLRAARMVLEREDELLKEQAALIQEVVQNPERRPELELRSSTIALAAFAAHSMVKVDTVHVELSDDAAKALGAIVEGVQKAVEERQQGPRRN